MRALPSDNTKKLALPKLRMTRSRPAVVGVHLRLIKVLAAASPVGRDERLDRIGSPKGVRVGGDAEVDQLG